MASPSTNALQAAMKARQQSEGSEDQLEDSTEQSETKQEVATTETQGEVIPRGAKKYLFNTAPCTVRVPGEGRVSCPDGTLTTDVKEIIEFMDKKVKAQLCKDITDDPKVERTDEQKVPRPTGQIFSEQQ